MSDKDLVFRGEVLARKCKYYVYDETGCCCEEFAVPVEDINRISAAPHEMSAREYEEALQRITHKDIETYGAWWEAINDEDWGRAVAAVEKWAREHPKEANDEREF